MAKGNEPKIICPECGAAILRRAKGFGRTKPDERLYHCPNAQCGEVFWYHELIVHWRAHQRPNLEVVRDEPKT